jgi:hypothetical protein
LNRIAKYETELVDMYNNILLFCLTLLGTHFSLKPAQFHNEILTLLAKKHRYNCIVAPRDHSKSTVVTLGYVLHQILFLQARFIIIISDTELQAKYFLNAIKTELEDNDYLKDIFGDLKGNIWGEEVIETNTGVRVIVRGANQKVRGLKWKHMRPDLIIIDDLENDELVENKERRDKLWQWYWKSVIPGLAKPNGRLVYVGTILHYDSVLNKLVTGEQVNDEEVSNINFHFLFYKAIQADGTALWADKYTLDDLNAIKQGYRKKGLLDLFYCEYMNEPISDENAIFKKEYFRYYEDDAVLIDSLAKFTLIDPAISQKQKACDVVVMTVGIDALNQIYVLEYDADHFDPIETIQITLRQAEKWKVSKIGVESVAYQKSLIWFLQEEMRRRNKYFLIEELKADMDKERRIKGLQPRYAIGSVFHKPYMTKLEEQLLLFPKGTLVDIIDVLAYTPQIGFRGKGSDKMTYKDSGRRQASQRSQKRGLASY